MPSSSVWLGPLFAFWLAAGLSAQGPLPRLPRPLFPGEEDFGIVPIEALACGSTVIAWPGRGAESVDDRVGALRFSDQRRPAGRPGRLGSRRSPRPI